MAFTPRRLIVQGLTYAASQLVTQLLPKVVYRGLHLRLSVTHTNSSANGLTVDSILQLISRLQVVLNGQDVVVSLSGQDLRLMNQYDFSIDVPQVITTGDGAGKISTVQLYIPFGLTRAANPEDTLLDARRVDSIVLECTWGSGTIATSGATVTAATLEVTTDEYANAPADLVAGRHELSVATRNLDAAGLISLNLETQSNNQYRRLFVITRNSGALSSAQLSRIAVKSRSFYYFDMYAPTIQDWNQQENGLAFQAGLYVLNFTRDGRQTQRIDARNLSELIVDMTSLVTDGTVRILKDKSIFATPGV